MDSLLLGKSPLGSLGGLRIVESTHLTIGPFEDWSNVRSPGRAARRRRQGHQQRIRIYYKPDPTMRQLPDGSLIGHPAAVRALCKAIDPLP